MKKRFIFDLDSTLLHGDFSKEKEYFYSVLPKEDAEMFLSNVFPLLMKYEEMFIRYEVENLSKFLTEYSKVKITPKMIEGWIDVNCTMDDLVLPETIEMLQYLKCKGKSLAVLTNWFKKSQAARLENQKILSYFDEVYGGDSYLKPNKESFILAAGGYRLNECIMIGDNVEKDVLGPNSIGMDSIYYNPENKEYNKTKIYSMDSFERIKEMY